MAQIDHRRYWEPSIAEFWSNAAPDDEAPGFPCFTVFLYKSVKEGEQGDEDPSKILDNVLFTFPSNVQDRHMHALIGGLQTFTTFSRLNLNKLLTSFTWSQSIIAVQTIELQEGDLLIMALKLPKFFSANSTRTALNNIIQALKFTIPEMNKKMTIEEANKLRELLKKQIQLIELAGFPQKSDDPFTFAAHPFAASASKAATCLATQLFEFARQTSPLVIGSAIFTKTDFVLTEIREPLLGFLPYFRTIAAKLPDFETSRFMTFPIWINFDEYGWTKKDGLPHECSLSVFNSCSISYYVLLDAPSTDIASPLAKLLSLLSNGIAEFAVECESSPKEKIEGNPAVIFWSDTRATKMSATTDIPFIQRMADMHNQFAETSNLRELCILQNQRYLTGMKLPKVEVIMEVKSDGQKPFIVDAYARLKELIPNLPQDLSKL
ncbi:hypothetical protein TVAG_123990 [Trichomonas vaginalis G3]|uniref:Uncharacterized protein n=1 Tax=Trichomonas vaginalis (strain ATCC PRA-98 / G3) TaxID=412133 RepID=A2EMZ0_TRIV3|nr:hypothetical protein TVAGG3_0742960 [Trichomonas vaginalis G3]EAY05975.1 hypothetical protein TVAG_123990 [Trichomonas vaginalis G3]KAI5512013.1 hypothetical protein TVAGG3_0742960 [Trichomonas vaginalis G3]|eukprot:XP_001318198.1 hypothetical protein [Trichomonas vaginalis G3]